MRIAAMLLCAALALSPASAGSDVLSDPAKRAEIEKVLTDLHKPDFRKLVVMADGTVYTVRAPRLGKSLGVVNLWHCFSYKSIGEENIGLLLGARVIGELEHDEYPAIAARQDVQCAEEGAQKKLSIKIGVWTVTVLLSM